MNEIEAIVRVHLRGLEVDYERTRQEPSIINRANLDAHLAVFLRECREVLGRSIRTAPGVESPRV